MIKSIVFTFSAIAVLTFATGCITTKKKGPPRPQMSNMPHNMPASWEGSGGLGGMPTSQ